MSRIISFLFTYTPLRYYVQSFWRDEAFSYLLAKQDIVSLLLTTARDANPPLYYLLLHFWMIIFGSSEISIRTVSFIFFLLTLYVIGLMLLEFFRMRAKWMFACLLLFAANPLLHYYAFEGRMYSMFAFFSLLSFYFLYKKSYRNYLISSILGLYTHYFMVFVLGVQFAYLLIVQKRLERKTLILYGKIALAALPWAALVVLSRPPVGGQFWVPRPTPEMLLNLPGRLFTGYEEMLGYTYTLIPLVTIFFILFFLLAGLKLVKSKKVHSLRHVLQDRLLLLLLLWVFVPLILIVAVSFIKPVFEPRYTIFITIGFIFLFIRLLAPFSRRVRAAFFLVALFFSLHYMFFQATYRTKGDVRTTLTEIKSLLRPGDVVYVTDPYDFHPAEYYINDKVVYIYGHQYGDLPWFIGKVLIPQNKIAHILPTYPRRAFIMTGDSTYTIQALY